MNDAVRIVADVCATIDPSSAVAAGAPTWFHACTSALTPTSATTVAMSRRDRNVGGGPTGARRGVRDAGRLERGPVGALALQRAAQRELRPLLHRAHVTHRAMGTELPPGVAR